MVHKKYNTEYFTFREIYLNIARIIGYLVLLLFVGLTINLSNLKIIFIVIIISIIMTIWLSYSLNNKQIGEKENEVK